MAGTAMQQPIGFTNSSADSHGGAPSWHYTVKPGDTLESVGAMFGQNPANIFNNNRHTIGSGAIYPGMRLKL